MKKITKCKFCKSNKITGRVVMIGVMLRKERIDCANCGASYLEQINLSIGKRGR